jgi:S1-C subfamily serine protease
MKPYAVALSLAALLLASPAVRAAPGVATIDDNKLRRDFTRGLSILRKAGKTATAATLIKQLGRRHHPLALPAVRKTPLSPTEIYARCKPSVVLIGSVYKCKRCTKWHTSIATGFFVTPGGAVATNYHVLNNPKQNAIGVMMHDGTMLAVKEVLAADEKSDAAVLQVVLPRGKIVRAIPLEVYSPAGTRVACISHPDRRFYSLSRGIVSRHFLRPTPKGTVPQMSVTADFAKGSSGGPILDERGNAVGMVSVTTTIYHKHEKDKAPTNPQMVVKCCTTAASIRALIAPGAAPPRRRPAATASAAKNAEAPCPETRAKPGR